MGRNRHDKLDKMDKLAKMDKLDNTETIIIASDHNGVQLKERLKLFLSTILSGSSPFIDLGPFQTTPVDYTDFARQTGEIVARGYARFGILICGTGVGMSIAANKITGIRAALVHDLTVAGKSREHNNSNILCLGAWVCGDSINLEATRIWLSSKFGGGRHIPRIIKLENNSRGKLVYTNGAFDLLHAGHVAFLREAASLGERLVVGVDSDALIRLSKGPNRPVQKQAERMSLVSSLRCVDEVVPLNCGASMMIRDLRPDVVVHAGDFSVESFRERDSIPDNVEAVVLPYHVGTSTTSIVDTILNGLKESK